MTGDRRRVAVGVDVGGTKVAAAVVVDARLVGEVDLRPTPARGGRSLIAAMADAVRHVLLEAPDSLAQEVTHVAVSTGGVVDPQSGRVTAASDLLRDWASRDLRAELSGQVGLRVVIENDGNAFARAQIELGAASAGVALCVAVGTGIGGGVVIDGRVHRGRRHLAGEFGHLPFPTSSRCSCGLTGHVEPVAAGPGLDAGYRFAGGAGRLAASDDADPVAVSVLTAGGESLGGALAGPAWSLDVDLVLLGGSVGRRASYRAGVESALNRTLAHDRRIPVLVGKGGPYAAIIGAVAGGPAPARA